MLLDEAGVAYEVHPSQVDEEPHADEDPVATAERTALAKAREIAPRFPRVWTLAADTVVAVPLENGIFLQLAKPESPAHAAQMLRTLAGRVHHVITGVALCRAGEEIVFHDRSLVLFRPLSEAEIAEYVATGEPMDKAGAYGLQGLGGTFVAHVEGSRENVIGLPIQMVLERLAALPSDVPTVYP